MVLVAIQFEGTLTLMGRAEEKRGINGKKNEGKETDGGPDR